MPIGSTTRRRSRRTAAKIEVLENRRLLSAAVAPVIVGSDNELNFTNYLPPKHDLWNPQGYLTKPSSDAPLTIALNYLNIHAADMGLTAADVSSPIVTDQYTDSSDGMTHIYLEQQYNGLSVVNSDITVNIAADGRILSINGGFVSDIATQAASLTRIPTRSAARALGLAGRQLGLNANASIQSAGLRQGVMRLTQFSAPLLSQDQIPMHLEYVPTARGIELAWDMVVHTDDNQHWFDVSVSDAGGQIDSAADWVDNASYNVLPQPTESPQDGPSSPNRAIVTDPADPVASPFGWQDTNGVAGAEFTDTEGNNVSAQEDVDANDTGGFRPDGGASLNFNFPLDLTQAPSTYQSAAITNLFYWNNLLHDIHYKYGFTEAAGNFQVNDYGRGGIGNDAVQADAQDGSGTNNSNFATPPDGQAPRMQMYIFTSTSPNRDGDLDDQIIIHEYGHGVSTRLTGGPANSDALDALQSGGMGEGWSDWWALMLTQKPTDGQNDGYPIAAYATGNPSGIRREPYSYSMTTDPLTVDAFGTTGSANGVHRSTEVHNTGEIWCSALWDMSWLLIDKYGFDPNVANGYNAASPRGNTLALQLVMNALKLQPANPSLKDARDAILQADVNLTGGANQSLIWQAFARRGMGVSFVDSSASATSVTPAYDVPLGPAVNAVTPSPNTLIPVSSATFTFNQAMDQTSFSVAGDVVSFTGPGNIDLRSTITGFSWLSSSQLQINFSTAGTPGAYTMTIGPNILAAANEQAMDQNNNGTPGEAGDAFTFSFTYTPSVGPDGFGYKAAAFPEENIDLQIGQSGVITLVNNANDGSGFVNLGSNTFNFYGHTYTGNAQISASANGLITFGATVSTFTNTDLASSPSVPAIAVLWDNWRTDQSAPGQTDSAVLYELQDTNGDSIPDRLIIEWSDVPQQTASNGSVTFQAILQLNTGSTPGRIVLNYPDVTTSSSTITNGASATVGIKDTGTQGANRLLISENNGSFPWIKDGSAIVISTDVTPPTIVSASFNYLNAQQYVVTFSEPIVPAPTAASLVLTNTTTNQIINVAATMSVLYGSSSKTLTFTALTTLPDGNYTAQLISSAITDAAGNPLDGDNDGIAGGNNTFKFFVLAGDANHDRVVNVADLNVIATNWMMSPRNFAQGDFNYDGVVNTLDLQILTSQWNKTLPPS